MLFLQIGDLLGKGLYPEKNLAFFKVEFFLNSHFGPNFRCSVHLDLPIPALHMSGVVIEVTFYFYSLFCSYAREWQAKLRELQESTQNKNNSKSPSASRRRSPSKDSLPNLPNLTGPPVSLGVLTGGGGAPPIVSITPSKRSSPPVKKSDINNCPIIKMDSNGALNLASTPSPPSSMDLASSTNPDSPSRKSPISAYPGAPRPPQGGFGVEMCVVCGDRASGMRIIPFLYVVYEILGPEK